MQTTRTLIMSLIFVNLLFCTNLDANSPVKLTLNLEKQTGKTLTEKKTVATTAFNGFYLGLDIGFQNIFGGAFIDDVDVLAQESKAVLGFSIGYRKRLFNSPILLGLQINYGFTDGNLTHSEPANQLKINYENNSQLGWGFDTGYAFGDNLFLFGYLQEARREFEITIVSPLGTFQQMDTQNFIKYGIGIEKNLNNAINLRIAIGQVYVDYEDLVTNIDVDDKMDVTIGITYKF